MNEEFIKQQKESYKKCMVEIIDTKIKDGFDTSAIRQYILNSTALTNLNDKIENLNNSTHKKDWEIEVLKNEIDILIELLNKYCPIEKLIIGEADNKNYSYNQTYIYKLLSRKEGYSNNTLIEILESTYNFKIEGNKVKSFIVDLQCGKFLQITV